ncbi:hypothetical protein WMY93_004036 [Mugilogobius chulae]|uniref:Uncharacterized protein n=1 Tax=Mugilogobius chulae TaxID=88201 RepID=A0AAW0Q2F2_9GOBI
MQFRGVWRTRIQSQVSQGGKTEFWWLTKLLRLQVATQKFPETEEASSAGLEAGQKPLERVASLPEAVVEVGLVVEVNQKAKVAEASLADPTAEVEGALKEGTSVMKLGQGQAAWSADVGDRIGDHPEWREVSDGGSEADTGEPGAPVVLKNEAGDGSGGGPEARENVVEFCIFLEQDPHLLADLPLWAAN